LAMDISGLTIVYRNEQNKETTLHKIPENTTVNAGAYIVFDKSAGSLTGSFPINKFMEISLVTPKKKADVFDRDEAIAKYATHPLTGSYARFPNGSSSWVVTGEATKNDENRLAFSFENSMNAIWMRGEHFRDATAATFHNFANFGIGHILVNEAVMTSTSAPTLTETAFKQKVNLANSYGLKVHIWFQCFFKNDLWVLPVIPETKQFNQPYFDELITRARKYVEYGNIAGIHLDYIRFSGVADANRAAYQHDYNEVVTGENAIAEFCRQLNVAVKAIDPDVKLSAALMFETTSNARYYGQNTQKMAKHIDILMPMVYRYTYGTAPIDKGVTWLVNTIKWFADEVKASGEKSEVWAGLKSYTALTASILIPLHPDDLAEDLRLAIKGNNGTPTGATGIVIFRYDLIDYCDMRYVND